MNYDQPFFHRSSPPFLGHYATRLLVGLSGSLGIVVLLLNLPLLYSPPQIGWTSERPTEPIPLQELSSEGDDASEHGRDPAATSDEVPPPTRHTPKEPEGTAGKQPTNAPDKSKVRQKEERHQSSSTPKLLAALTTEDRHPQIKGGNGALYLQIRYPEAARQQGIEGRLELEFTVDREGQVHAIEVTESLHPLCDSAAVEALRSVEFRPAIHQGNRIPVRMSLPIRFKILNQDGPLHTQRRPSSR